MSSPVGIQPHDRWSLVHLRHLPDHARREFRACDLRPVLRLSIVRSLLFLINASRGQAFPSQGAETAVGRRRRLPPAGIAPTVYGRSASDAGPGPGVIRIGHWLERNGTTGGSEALSPSLALSAAIATRASPPISS